jgi:tetratricopeptide (TPR) repeat protein
LDCVSWAFAEVRIVAAFLLAIAVGCAPKPAPVVVAPRLAPAVLAERLADADRLASRGCYLCLKEAAAAYAALLAETDDRTAVARALESNLMLAMREIELRMPDSGARDAAEQLQDQAASDYTPYFAALDALRLAEPVILLRGQPLLMKEAYDARLKALAELETDAPASAMKAYFFIASALTLRDFKELKPTVDAVLAAHPLDLSLKYRMLAFQPTYSGDAARALIGQETGFGEVHLLLGQRAFLSGDLPGAFRDLTRARQLLPDSASIALALANVTFAYARYADALALFDHVVSSPAAAALQPQAKFGRARALSYLKRHDEAIALLIDLLQNDSRNSPGDKYYWRSWNQLQLGRAQLAYDDAMAGLNVMRNNAIYQLAGLASFGLNRRDEARKYFEEALNLNTADCDSERYLGLLDSAERRWPDALRRFGVAAKCYEVVLVRMREELTDYEKDITGLSNSLIAGKRIEIREAQALRDQSLLNAAAAARNSQ